MSVFIAPPKKNIQESIRAILDNYEGGLDFSKGVFLKPNIVFPVAPRSRQITSPGLVRALVIVLREAHPNIEIIIGEGTAAGTNPIENFRVSGYVDMARELGVTLLDLDQAERVELKWKYGTIDLPKVAFDKTYISLPILKVSSAAVISGAMKNQKGLLSPSMKKRFHRWRLHEPIAELSIIVKPSLTIMDGSNFFKGRPLIAGDNLYEMDSSVVKLLNIDDPEYLKVARKWEMARNAFRIQGYDFLRPKALKRKQEKFKKFLGIRLWANPRACSMCRLTLNDLRTFRAYSAGRSSPTYWWRMLQYAVRGAEFVFGSEPQFEAESSTVVCFGDCTKELAQKNGYLHIPGCPPTKNELLKYLFGNLGGKST